MRLEALIIVVSISVAVVYVSIQYFIKNVVSLFETILNIKLSC